MSVIESPEGKDLRRPVAHCGNHTRYTAGCTQCQVVRQGYRQTRRDADRRDRLARAAAWRRLVAAHPDEYRKYFAEELEARTPGREGAPQ